MQKLLVVFILLFLSALLVACPNTAPDSSLDSSTPSTEESSQPTESTAEATEASTETSTESASENTAPETEATEDIALPTFQFSVDPEPTIVDGEHLMVSDTNLTISYHPGDTWITFIHSNPDAGFYIAKDFYGVEDLVYYLLNKKPYTVRQVVAANHFTGVKPDDAITHPEYACVIPHRESIQSQWLYEVSDEPFMVEGHLEPFNRQGKVIILDVDTMTYTIKYEKLQKISALSFVRETEIIASGSYTSDDGDTLGSTLTLDNGYVLKTNRSKYYSATLIIDGKSISATSADHCNFYQF